MICFATGFIAAASLVVMDDRMAANYGYEPPWEVSGYVRKAAFYVETALCEGKRMGEFYGVYFDELVTAVREEWDSASEGGEEEREPRVLEAFHAQKL